MHSDGLISLLVHCRAGELSAGELQEYFAKVLRRPRDTEELLVSVASLLPAGKSREALLQAARRPLEASLDGADEWTSLDLDTSTVNKSELQEAAQAAHKTEETKASTKRMAPQGSGGKADSQG